MPLIRYRAKDWGKDLTEEQRAFIGYLETNLNGEPIEDVRGIFYLHSDHLIRYLVRRIEKNGSRGITSEYLEMAKLALDWLNSTRLIPKEGLVPSAQIRKAIAAFVDEPINEKAYDHVECPACARCYTPAGTRLFYWSEETFSSRYDGYVTYCGQNHVIRYSLISVSTITRDLSVMHNPIYDKTQYEMIEKFPNGSTV